MEEQTYTVIGLEIQRATKYVSLEIYELVALKLNEINKSRIMMLSKWSKF